MAQEPLQRFSHQILYSEAGNDYIMFGGNPHDIPVPKQETERLNDLWTLKLGKPSKNDIFEQAKYLIKKEQYLEQCQQPRNHTSNKRSLNILFNDLVSRHKRDAVIDSTHQGRSHIQNPEIRDLCMQLILPRQKMEDDDTTKSRYQDRIRVFEQLMRFYPESMRQPVKDI